MVNDDLEQFRTLTLARPAETVALTSPTNATSVFQVDLSPELLLPFEGCGLDAPFELQLPKAINSFDYRTIADVQVSVDYTALYSPAYAAEVVRRLPSGTSNSVALSLRDFPDAWYALLTQAKQLAGPPATAAQGPAAGPPVLLAQWTLGAGELPANLADPSVEQLTLMVARTGTLPEQFTIDHLRHDGVPPANSATGAKTVGDILSTRSGSGASWRQLTGYGLAPSGVWELGLLADSETIGAIAGGEVQDLVLVITYSAQLPSWPRMAGG